MKRAFPAVPFIITGCQRSGTAYSASLFSALGCPCSFEAIFCAENLRRRWLSGRLLGRVLHLDAHREFLTPAEVGFENVRRNSAPLRGEKSWWAAPYLAAFPTGTVVLHQLREPIAVVRSVLRNWLFTDSTRRTFVEQHCPALRRGSRLERSMLYWIEWNALAARAQDMSHLRYFRYKVENLTPVLVQSIFDLIGCSCDPAGVTAALSTLPRDTHTRGSKRRDHTVIWETLPASAIRDRLARTAAAYGYPNG